MHLNDSENPEVKKPLPTSKSMHGFYNRTWNERSLSKYQHNYENVYNNYENYDCQSCVINQLTCSPKSARGYNFEDGGGQAPVPPERKGRGRKRNGVQPQQLYRSKSCERPKMRDTFRMDKFAANFNRISSNITDKMFKKEDISEAETSREIANNSILQSVALRAIPCVDIQVEQNFL